MGQPVGGIIGLLAALGTSRLVLRLDPPLVSFEYRTDCRPENEIKIYIMYGPPNSIEAHPVGAAQPYELWHYREIKEFGPAEHQQGIPNYKIKVVTRKDVDMKFVDACRCGEFQLQPVRN
jgi:hypothetical protein